MPIHCQAALAAKQPLQPHSYEPAELGPFDIEVAITHCGLCHSDIHLIDDDWGMSQYPLIPGHEIIGTVRAVGPEQTALQVGQRVGVGWQCLSCLQCEWCLAGDEVACSAHQPTCVGRPGGFAEAIRVDGRFAYPIPDELSSENAAPLLCAGITVYTPLSKLPPRGGRVGIIGIGGLGHLALQFAAAFGYEVTAFSTSAAKEEEARAFGAHRFINSRDTRQMESAARSLDLLLTTVSAELDWSAWMKLLRPHGQLCFVGASPGTLNVSPMDILFNQSVISGSGIGTRSMHREMLRFAALHGIVARTETLPMTEINTAVQRVRSNEARYRMVLVN